MDNNVFSYTYSAKENTEIQRIRNKYINHESDFDILKKLDRKVQQSGQVPGLTIGIIGSLVFGIGMCFGLGVFPTSITLSVVFCLMGLFIALTAYPVYKYIHQLCYNKHVPQILELADKLQHR